MRLVLSLFALLVVSVAQAQPPAVMKADPSWKFEERLTNLERRVTALEQQRTTGTTYWPATPAWQTTGVAVPSTSYYSQGYTEVSGVEAGARGGIFGRTPIRSFIAKRPIRSLFGRVFGGGCN